MLLILISKNTFYCAVIQNFMFIQVLITKQRYKFESNSQRADIAEFYGWRCLLQSKDTNLKAIHNYTWATQTLLLGAYYKAKIQI